MSLNVSDSNPNTKQLTLISLGCAKNTVQSQVAAGLLSEAGYVLVDDARDADIMVINSCGFITAAKEESIEAILEAARLKETGQLRKIVVMGCMVQKYADELQKTLPEVDLWLGTSHHQDLLTALESLEDEKTSCLVGSFWQLPELADYENRMLTDGLPYAYLTIADGCDNACSFCAIPEMTGPYRSRPMEDIVAEAKALVEAGYRELILIAQDTTYYGRDLYGRFALADLLTELCRIEDLLWLRLLYAYPNNFGDDLISVMASEKKICHYLDLPIQHADNEILAAMGRNITIEEIEDLIARLRRAMPDIVLRSTFITGFPGETEEAYKRLLNFLEKQALDRVGVFPYSQEEGTPAGRRRNQVPNELREERAQALMTLQTGIMHTKDCARIGQELLVCIDERSMDDPDLYLCRSYGEAPDVDPLILVWMEHRELRTGDFLRVRIVDVLEYDLVGEAIDEST